ncbi:MAG: glycosyltransferase [Paludibacteraceae bacterium]|nr:glycosyltransferase [Paludibacteraceae bacterium]
MANKPIISIVTIVFNGKDGIEKTIKSVLSQTYKNIEYIIIDGASTDGTLDIIQRYKPNLTKLISERDSGIYNAMNKGLALAKGDYIYFANSGDLIADDDVIRKVAEAIVANDKWPDLVYGCYQELNNNVVGPIIPCRNHKWSWYGMFASHQSVFCKKEVIDEHNIIFDESYKIAADYKFLLTIVKHSHSFLQLPFSISLFDVSGVSSTNQDKGLYEADRARKEVLELNWFKRKFIIFVSLLARYSKKHLGVIYRSIRNR